MARMNRRPEIQIDDTRLVFRNFSGEEKRYNEKGRRNVCVILPDQVAEDLDADGYNIKRLKPRDDEEQGPAYIKVNVGYSGGKPPHIVMITSRGRTALDEATVGALDFAEIIKCDLIFSPYQREDSVTAWLKTMFVTIEEDALEARYADVGNDDPGFDD